MSPIESLLARLDETERRFRERQAPRESATRSLEQGDFAGANPDEALRQRLERLGADPGLTERVGTRSFSLPRRPAESDVRALIDNLALERILGKSDLMPVSYLALGQFRARSVGRIHIKDASGRRLGFGTGFLVSPRLLLTNNHVLESGRDAASSEVEFDFEVDLAGEVRRTATFRLDPASLFLTDRRLDFTLVALAPGRGREPREWGWIVLSDRDGLIVKGEYASIVQHPNGEAKQLALRENRVIDLLDDFAHYHTDTAPGSSGSPVFNDQWELIALHHSGVPDRFENGDIRAVDGRKWEPWMGDHRIKWVANEGVFGKKIVEFVKRAMGLSAAQRRLLDGLFDGPPPVPESGPTVPSPRPTEPAPSLPEAEPTQLVPSFPATGPSATWTIPLHVRVSFGAPQPGTAPAPSPAIPPTATAPVDVTPAADADLRQDLSELNQARGRSYYDAEKNRRDREDYYASLRIEGLPKEDAFRRLSELLTATHTESPSYKPSRHVYPWVDLHPDLKLRSIYSGKAFDPEELIREDFRIAQERAELLQELTRQENGLTAERLQEQADLLEAQIPFNCEHAVPQSWFAKQEPMRGDLHHLFACESGCNSFRGNIPYFDFSDFEEAERTACGKRVGDKFEPVAGKGPVARATLYFLLRYPGKVDDPGEFPGDRLSTLLRWHGDDPVTDYERHRNQAIFEKQGNRNPLIDYPDWAGKINFALGYT